MDTLPLVSIIIPVYNGYPFLTYAIESSLKQTYPNIEIIVVNDGSPDGGKTHDIALSFGSKIRYFEKTNGGVSSALNFGVSKSRGQYISWLSHDDEYLPTKIEKEVRAILKRNENTVVYCRTRFINGDERPIFKLCSDSRFYATFRKPGLVFKHDINGCSLLLPKKALVDYPFDEQLRVLQDHDCWFKLLANGYAFENIPKRLTVSRIHEAQITYKMKDKYPYEEQIFSERIKEYLFLKKDRRTALDVLYCRSLKAFKGNTGLMNYTTAKKWVKDLGFWNFIVSVKSRFLYHFGAVIYKNR